MKRVWQQEVDFLFKKKMTGRRTHARNRSALIALACWSSIFSLAAAAPSQHGVTLSPLDPAMVDDSSRSISSGLAIIHFVNKSGGPVDIYWIDFSGRRVLYATSLAAGATFPPLTYLGHPWLVVRSGTGGRAVRDTGMRLAGFQAQTPNPAYDPAIFDTAIIYAPADEGGSVTEPSPAVNQGNDVVEPCTALAGRALELMVNPPPARGGQKSEIFGLSLASCGNGHKGPRCPPARHPAAWAWLR
jgi:hypothetical protein